MYQILSKWSGFVEDMTKHFGLFFRFTMYLEEHSRRLIAIYLQNTNAAFNKIV